MELEILIPSLIGYLQLTVMFLMIGVALPIKTARVQNMRNRAIAWAMPKKRFFSIQAVGFAASFILNWEEFAAMFAVNAILGAVFYFLLRPYLVRKYGMLTPLAKAEAASL